MTKSQKYNDYLIIGWNGETINEGKIIDAFASTGNGERFLEEAREKFKGQYQTISLHKTTARLFG